MKKYNYVFMDLDSFLLPLYKAHFCPDMRIFKNKVLFMKIRPFFFTKFSLYLINHHFLFPVAVIVTIFHFLNLAVELFPYLLEEPIKI